MYAEELFLAKNENFFGTRGFLRKTFSRSAASAEFNRRKRELLVKFGGLIDSKPVVILNFAGLIAGENPTNCGDRHPSGESSILLPNA